MLINTRSDDFLSQILQRLEASTDIKNLTPGSIIYILSQAFAAHGEDLVDAINAGIMNSLIATAPSEWLDVIGRGMYVFRETGSTAYVTASDQVIRFYARGGQTFGDINGGEALTIPAGTSIFTGASPDGRQTEFITTADAYAYATNSEIYVSASAVAPGPITIAQGMLSGHNFTAYKDARNNSLLVTNDQAIAGGSFTEDDESYRYRIANAIYRAQAANAIAITSAVMALPNVADVKVIPMERGAGTVTVYVTPTIAQPASSMVQVIREIVQPVVAAGTHVDVRLPQFVGIELAGRLQVTGGVTENERSSLVAAVRAALMKYINNLPIGAGLYQQQLLAHALGISDKVVRVGAGATVWDLLQVYRPTADGNRVPSTAVRDILVKPFEKIVCESSIPDPVRIV